MLHVGVKFESSLSSGGDTCKINRLSASLSEEADTQTRAAEELLQAHCCQ